jgi:DNA gyrase subunit A
MVQRTGVRGISRYGRLSQGVRVMNMKSDDVVSAVALVVDSGNGNGNDGAVVGLSEQGDETPAPAPDSDAPDGVLDDPGDEPGLTEDEDAAGDEE